MAVSRVSHFRSALTFLIVFLCLSVSGMAQETPATDSWTSRRGSNLNRGTTLSGKDVQKGVVKWRFLSSTRITTSPVVKGGVVYFGDQSGIFYAVDTKSGKRVWERDLEVEKDGFTFSSPVILSDRVITATQAGLMVALSISDGSILWRRRFEAEIYSSMKFAEGRVLFGCKDFKFRAIDPKNGKDIWSYETGDVVGCTAAITRGGKVIFAGHDKSVHVLDLKTGKRLNRYPLGYRSTGIPALAFGCIYMCTTGRRFTCFDLLSGAVRWTAESLNSHQQGVGVWKNRVIVHIGKYAMCFDAQTGKTIWRTILKGRGDIAPAVGTKCVYLSDVSGHVYAIDAESGEIKWEVTTSKGSFSSPALVDGVLYVGDGDGYLNAIH